MTHDDGIQPVTPADGNVFADPGFAPDKARALAAQSQAIIDRKLAMKLALMSAVADWIKREKLKQADAVVILGVSRPRVSDIVQRKTRNFTIDALTDMAMRTGQNVAVIVG